MQSFYEQFQRKSTKKIKWEFFPCILKTGFTYQAASLLHLYGALASCKETLKPQIQKSSQNFRLNFQNPIFQKLSSIVLQIQKLIAKPPAVSYSINFNRQSFQIHKINISVVTNLGTKTSMPNYECHRQYLAYLTVDYHGKPKQNFSSIG